MSLLRELVIGIGFQIDTANLGAADQMTDQFKAKALSAESNVLQLGASVAQAGHEATIGIGGAAAATAGLGSEVGSTQGVFTSFREWGCKAVDAVKAKFEEHREQIQSIGKALNENKVVIGAIFAITAGVIGTSIGTAANFEAAMSRVGAVSRASQEEMALLTTTAKDLGATTVFSASQAAEGMQYLAMAGFQTNEIVGAMPGLLDTAAAAQTDLGSTADIVSNILSGFGIAADDTGRVADVLTATFTTSNTTLTSLGESMKMVAPVATALGVSLEEAAAMTGTLGNMGIQGTMAGTALRTVLSSLAAPTGEAAKQLAALGIQTADATGNMLPVTDILDQIATKTAHMGDAQRTAFLETLAGRQGVTALTALLSVGADQIDDYTESLRDSAGVAKDVADKQMDNLRGSLTQLGSAVEGAKISIGTAFIPVIRLGAKVLTALVTAFNKLPGPVKTIIAVGLGAVAMLAGAALAAAVLIPQITKMKTGFLALKGAFAVVKAVGVKTGVALTASFWPIVLGAAAIVAGILLIQDVMMAFRGEGDTLTAKLFNWASAALGFSIKWEEAVVRIKDWFFGLVDAFKSNPIGFLIDWSPFGLLRRGTEALLGWFGNWLAERGIKLPEFQLPTFPDLIGWASGAFDTFLTWLSEFDLGSAIGTAIGAAWDGVTKPLSGLTQKIRDWFPFSPAKEGPLADLDKAGLGLVDTVASSIDSAGGTGKLEGALASLLGTASAPAMTDSMAAAPTSGRAAYMPTGGPVLNLTVNVDAANATQEDAERIGEQTAASIRDVLEQWVSEAFYSVALEEV